MNLKSPMLEPILSILVLYESVQHIQNNRATLNWTKVNLTGLSPAWCETAGVFSVLSRQSYCQYHHPGVAQSYNIAISPLGGRDVSSPGGVIQDMTTNLVFINEICNMMYFILREYFQALDQSRLSALDILSQTDVSV